jgi:hypothetical protein
VWEWVGVGSGVLVTAGVLVGRGVGVALWPQAKVNKLLRNTTRRSLPTFSPLIDMTRKGPAWIPL